MIVVFFFSLYASSQVTFLTFAREVIRKCTNGFLKLIHINSRYSAFYPITFINSQNII